MPMGIYLNPLYTFYSMEPTAEFTPKIILSMEIQREETNEK